MDIQAWKAQLPPVLGAICREMIVNDAAIDWVDITFDQIGGATRCPPHLHNWFEFNYVLSGRMVTSFGSEAFTIREKEFFLVPPGVIHSHTYTKGNPHEGFSFRFRLRKLPGSGAVAAGTYDRFARLAGWRPGCYTDGGDMLELLLRLFRIASRGGSALALQLTLVQLLEQLAEIRQIDEQWLAERTPAPDPLVKKVEIYLEDFYGEQVSVQELAASLHMSYGHLSRLYKQRTGQTIIERMNQIRLTKACKLLEDSALQIKDVCGRAGFPDIYYFSRGFKRKFGVSPSVYRKRLADSAT